MIDNYENEDNEDLDREKKFNGVFTRCLRSKHRKTRTKTNREGQKRKKT